MTIGVFDSMLAKSFPYRFNGQLTVKTIAGGVPSDPRVAEGWLKTKMGLDKEEQLQKAVAEVMVERGITLEEATEQVNKFKNLNGFKRLVEPMGPDEQDVAAYTVDTVAGQLYIEGRQLKAAIKEAISVAAAVGKVDLKGWGLTRKWINAFAAEHLFIVEDRLPLYVYDENGDLQPATEPTDVVQRFVKNKMGQMGISYEEYIDEAIVHFTLSSDNNFDNEFYGMLWTTGEQQGLGASRSQGFGRYKVTRWEKIKV
jgi:hypothetical protein